MRKIFFPWPPQELVQNCLDHVLRSDIFLLFVSQKAEAISPNIRQQLLIANFKKHIRTINILSSLWKIIFITCSGMIYALQLVNWLKIYNRKYGMDPDSYRDIAEAAWNNHPEKSDSIESYVWGFLYDIYRKGHYLEQMSIGVDGIKTIKKYFSDLFRQGSKYLALQSDIDEQIAVGPTYRKHAEFTSKMIGYLKNGELQRPRLFLEYLQRFLKKGTVYHKPGTVFEIELGEYESCSGSTLYKKDGARLRLIAASGMASLDNEYYHLDDPSSFVVQAFNNVNPELFFGEEKRQFYLSLRSGSYVVCFHYL